MDTREHILELETSLLKPDVRRNHRLLNSLLADDFKEFGATGCVWTKTDILAAMEDEEPVARVIDDFEVRPLASDVVLATYLCHHTSPSGLGHSSRRISIWREAPMVGRWSSIRAPVYPFNEPAHQPERAHRDYARFPLTCGVCLSLCVFNIYAAMP